MLDKNALAFGDELSFYARMYADSSYSGSTVPRRNPVVSVGIRWESWYNRVVFAALEQLQSLHDNNQSDTLARLPVGPVSQSGCGHQQLYFSLRYLPAANEVMER